MKVEADDVQAFMPPLLIGNLPLSGEVSDLQPRGAAVRSEEAASACAKSWLTTGRVRDARPLP